MTFATGAGLPVSRPSRKELLTDPDPARAEAALNAMLDMRKIVIADLEAAAANP